MSRHIGTSHFKVRTRPRRAFLLGAFAGGLLIACARERNIESPRMDLGITRATTAEERIVVLDSAGLGLREPALMNPAYVRHGPAGVVWLLDTGRGAVFEYRQDGKFVTRYGRKGHGRGQMWIPIAMDVSPQGTVWVVDAGNGKVVGFRRGGETTEFPIDFQPAGIAAVSDTDLWIAGDLRSSLFVRLNAEGQKRGSVGLPADTGRTAFRSNQGVAAQGGGACAVLWAYSYRSRLECYDASGNRRWIANGPTNIEWPKDANPFRMSANDRLAYLDVTAAQGKVFALFLGSTGIPKSRELQVFDEENGKYLGVARLADSSTHVAITPTGIATVELTGEQLTPHLRVFARAAAGGTE